MRQRKIDSKEMEKFRAGRATNQNQTGIVVFISDTLDYKARWVNRNKEGREK